MCPSSTKLYNEKPRMGVACCSGSRLEFAPMVVSSTPPKLTRGMWFAGDWVHPQGLVGPCQVGLPCHYQKKKRSYHGIQKVYPDPCLFN